ncbi:MAG: LacI family DNA-binding transcriptional regulator [Rhodoglobus sp.]
MIVSPRLSGNGTDSPGPRSRARLVDVAERCGVTKSIVSRIMNDDETLRIRPETRARVLEVARELGYRPHAGARALSVSRTGALALLIPDLTNTVYTMITRGAYRRARERGYVLLIAEDTADDASGDYTELVTSGRVDGLLVASARPGHPLITELLEAPDSVAHVFVNREVDGSDRNVGIDMRGASALAARYLAQHGHTHIGMVAGPADLAPARARIDGFRDGMGELGVDDPPIFSGEFSEIGGYDAALELLRRHPEVTGLYASSFGQAVGVIKAARDLGIDIPSQLSVIGYDDLPVANFLEPPLTTIAMPLAELGAAAVDALVEQLEHRTVAPRVIEGGYRVIERGSVAQSRA